MDSPCPVISLPAGLKERHPQPVSFGLEPTFIDPPSPGIHVDQQQWVAGIVDDAVNKALSRMEQLFSDQKAELEAKEAAAEKALKSRLKKEKKERAEERGDLVEAIREMALELGDRDNGNDDEPIVLKDAVGRKFIFPFETCRTWRSFSDLLIQAFTHVDILGPHVHDGFYDILSPRGMVILPSVWEDIIEPGWEISMHMWPLSDGFRPNGLGASTSFIADKGTMPPPPMPPPPPVGEVFEGERGWGGCGGGGGGTRAHRPHRLDEIVEEEREGAMSLRASVDSMGESICTVEEKREVKEKNRRDRGEFVEEVQNGEWEVLDD